MLSMKIFSSLKEMRDYLGMTQQELGDSIESSRNYIALVESGKRGLSSKLKNRVLELITKKDNNNVISQDLPPHKCRDCQEKDIIISERNKTIIEQSNTIVELSKTIADQANTMASLWRIDTHLGQPILNFLEEQKKLLEERIAKKSTNK